MNQSTRDRSIHTASGVNIVLGCWLIASPWIFRYSADSNALWNSVVVGALVVIFASGRVAAPLRSLETSWVILLLGLWAIASPWVYSYAANSAARWDCVAVGIAIALLAGSSGRLSKRGARDAHVPTTPVTH